MSFIFEYLNSGKPTVVRNLKKNGSYVENKKMIKAPFLYENPGC